MGWRKNSRTCNFIKSTHVHFFLLQIMKISAPSVQRHVMGEAEQVVPYNTWKAPTIPPPIHTDSPDQSERRCSRWDLQAKSFITHSPGTSQEPTASRSLLFLLPSTQCLTDVVKQLPAQKESRHMLITAKVWCQTNTSQPRRKVRACKSWEEGAMEHHAALRGRSSPRQTLAVSSAEPNGTTSNMALSALFPLWFCLDWMLIAFSSYTRHSGVMGARCPGAWERP